MDRVRYHHLMFDRHEIVFSEGCPTESFYAYGAYADQDPGVRDELQSLFPELFVEGQEAAQIDTARHVLKRHEASAL